MPRKPIHASQLGIDLPSLREGELFKWFLACLLFGKPIQQEVARQTFEEFFKEGLVSPGAVLDAGWDRLVEILDRGHYVRYDFSTATKLLEVCQALKNEYGSVSKLLARAASLADLGRRLQEFKGIGPVTARIFLREIKPRWKRLKALKPGRHYTRSSQQREDDPPFPISYWRHHDNAVASTASVGTV